MPIPTHNPNAESSSALATAIQAVQSWPEMAKFVARCIDTVRGHEKSRALFLQRLAAKDHELEQMTRRCELLEAELHQVRAELEGRADLDLGNCDPEAA